MTMATTLYESSHILHDDFTKPTHQEVVGNKTAPPYISPTTLPMTRGVCPCSPKKEEG